MALEQGLVCPGFLSGPQAAGVRENFKGLV